MVECSRIHIRRKYSTESSSSSSSSSSTNMNLEAGHSIYSIGESLISTYSSLYDCDHPSVNTAPIYYPLIPSDDPGQVLKDSPGASSPKIQPDGYVLIHPARLAELEYLEKNINLIIKRELEKYNSNHSPTNTSDVVIR